LLVTEAQHRPTAQQIAQLLPSIMTQCTGSPKPRFGGDSAQQIVAAIGAEAPISGKR
jgi:hypothetical protein